MSIRNRDQLRASLAQDLADNTMRYKYAIVREVALILGDYKQSDIAENQDQIIDLVMKRFNIPASAKNEMLQLLGNYQQGIVSMWDQYFDGAGVDVKMTGRDLDNMMALYHVDFERIKQDTRSIIVDEIRKTARIQQGYTELRSRLMKRGLGYGQASTLANTGLAQFDNAYMQDISKRAGVDRFLYDGVLHPTSRRFCSEHYGKVYTLAEILEMDNGQGIPVLTSCGGYNCVHYWTPEV